MRVQRDSRWLSRANIPTVEAVCRGHFQERGGQKTPEQHARRSQGGSILRSLLLQNTTANASVQFYDSQQTSGISPGDERKAAIGALSVFSVRTKNV